MIGLGSLQIMLDKGQREDWFASGLIIWLAVITAVSLAFFIVIELYSEHPVVDLRAFRRPTFALGNTIVLLAFVTLFGSLVLLPLFAQKMMGYSATLAGLALAPGGLATLIVMPIVGRLVVKINLKVFLGVSIAGIAISAFLMGRFNLYIDFAGIMWPRVVMGVALGCLFVPLTALTLRQLPNEEMANGTAIYSLLRNIGGSIGIAFVTTMLSRSAQIHQVYLAGRVTIFDRAYQWYTGATSSLMGGNGFSATSLLYGKLLREANMLAFNDAFLVLSGLMVLVLPLVFFMKRLPVDTKGPIPFE